MIKTAKTIINTGGLRSLYVGMGATMLRDIPGFAVFFSVYEGISVSQSTC